MTECEKIRLLMVDTVYQSEHQRSEKLEEHLAGCRTCRQAWAGLKETREYLRLSRRQEAIGAGLGPTTAEIVETANRYRRAQWFKQASGWMVAAVFLAALLANGRIWPWAAPSPGPMVTLEPTASMQPIATEAAAAPAVGQQNSDTQAIVELMLEVNTSLQQQISEMRKELAIIGDELQRQETSKALLLASIEEIGSNQVIRN